MAGQLKADLALMLIPRDDGGMSKLKVQRFDIPGPALITPKRHADERGWFSETWNEKDWADAGLPQTDWMQDNEAFTSIPGTIRGLHFQAPPHAQAKLIRVIEGVTAAKDTRVAYKCDNLYAPESEGGLHWKAPGLDIDWPVTNKAQVNERDAAFPWLTDLNSPFVWNN